MVSAKRCVDSEYASECVQVLVLNMIVFFGGGLPAWLQIILVILSLLSQAPSWSQRTVRLCGRFISATRHGVSVDSNCQADRLTLLFEMHARKHSSMKLRFAPRCAQRNDAARLEIRSCAA